MSFSIGLKPDFTATTNGSGDEGKGFKIGQIVQDHDGKWYKFVQYDTGAGSVAAVSGNVCYYYTLDGYKNNQVTSDLSDSVEIGRYDQARRESGRFGRYLSTRSPETWMFFVAGVFLGGFFF